MNGNDRRSAPEGADDDRRSRILDGAVTVFLAYGFQRTTMDDIARAAEISRPALYLDFRNKTDIYRAIAARMLERSSVLAHRALDRDAPLGERIAAALEDCVFSMVETFQASPHGAEILDMKGSLAGDIVGGWRDELCGLIAAAIRKEARRRGIDLAARGLEADVLANALLDGLEGAKLRVSDAGGQRQAVRALIRMIELALQP